MRIYGFAEYILLVFHQKHDGHANTFGQLKQGTIDHVLVDREVGLIDEAGIYAYIALFTPNRKSRSTVTHRIAHGVKHLAQTTIKGMFIGLGNTAGHGPVKIILLLFVGPIIGVVLSDSAECTINIIHDMVTHNGDMMIT